MFCKIESSYQFQYESKIPAWGFHAGHEIIHFPTLFQGLVSIVTPSMLVLDKAYDAGWVHQSLRECGILPMIPLRNLSDCQDRVKGRFRKKMRRTFDRTLYHQRNKRETVLSVIKRRFGSEIKSHEDGMKERGLLYRVLAYNCHRMR